MSKARSKRMSMTKRANSKSGMIMKVRRVPMTNMNTGVTVSGSGNYGPNQENGVSGEEYLTLVAQRSDGNWTYVRVNEHCLDGAGGTPVIFNKTEAPELLDLWKRAVIDAAIPWEDSIKPDTLRIVSYRVETQDRTISLFENDADVTEWIRRSALSKLNTTEAKLLGLDNMKAKQMLFRNPDFDRDDRNLLESLHKASSGLSLNRLLSDMTE